VVVHKVWNAPTWFLSALAFATMCLPFVLPAVASWRKKGLKTVGTGQPHNAFHVIDLHLRPNSRFLI